MSDFFIGEIRAFAFNFAPQGWALANGAVLPVQQNQALYALIGNIYGGSSPTTFALPDLRGRAAVSQGVSPISGVAYTCGEIGGAKTITLKLSNLPPHNHMVLASTNPGTTSLPQGDNLAAVVADTSTPPNLPNIYAALATPTVELDPATISVIGQNGAHNNVQPTTVVNYCIATTGLFPSRS